MDEVSKRKASHIVREDETVVVRKDEKTVLREDEKIVVPVIEEHLEVHKRELETGGVRIRKVVNEREEVVDVPLLREEIEIERVAVNRIVDGKVEVRYEGDTMIVPVLEEVLVTEKRLMLKEELRVTRKRRSERSPQSVTLRSEEVVVERIEPGPASPRGNGATVAGQQRNDQERS
jgi:uncharacterized protein (TIGR02271 family)